MATAEGLEAALVLTIAATMARRVSLPRWWHAIRGLRTGGHGDTAERIGRRVQRLGARVPGAGGCYPQALAAAALLRHHGHRPELVVGVRNRPFRAHAWVEVDGAIVAGGVEAPDYTEIWRGTT